jgi:hypothetical protein
VPAGFRNLSYWCARSGKGEFGNHGHESIEECPWNPKYLDGAGDDQMALSGIDLSDELGLQMIQSEALDLAK